MNGFFSKKTVVVILIAVLISLILAIMSAVSGGRISPVASLVNIISEPLQKACGAVTDFFSDRADRALRYDELEKENQKLREELSLLRQALRENEAMEKENVQLRAALAMRERDSSFVFESAEIIAKNADNWTRSFTINKGATSGLTPDNCVITSDGMVGYISEVGATWATVTAITDTTMEASAIASRTRDVASAEGDFELMSDGCFRLSYLPRNTQVLAGDIIETSGVGGLFPKGIVLGYVVEVRNESHGISKYAIVKPAVDLDRVNHVLVIKSFESVS
ncbi:MAG: rod shape-determining protein MreC [Oscillospiraceae bacterium]|nr:rod shape-determining protein MreC [Oscillospiraceae bacterium]